MDAMEHEMQSAHLKEYVLWHGHQLRKLPDAYFGGFRLVSELACTNVSFGSVRFQVGAEGCKADDSR